MAERRSEHRTRAFKGAKINFRGVPVLDCIIRDLSSQGACLQVTSQQGIPAEFDLVINSDQSTRPCRITWRKANRIGVRFR